MNTPQWLIIVLLVIEFMSHIRRMHVLCEDTPVSNTMIAVLRVGGISSLLYWGGFWA